MKISADYRMLALDALRGKWKTAALTGIAASALGATIVSSSNSVVSNSNQAKDIHPPSSKPIRVLGYCSFRALYSAAASPSSIGSCRSASCTAARCSFSLSVR